MGLTWVFLLMLFIAPQAFAQSFTLTATAGQGKVDLSWTDAGKSGYDLYFCEDTTSTACTVPTSGGANPPYLGWITSGTTFEHTGLTPGKTYRYQVTHYSPTRRSNVAMAVPLGLTASSITRTGATLTLGGHTGNWHYKETAPSTTATCSGAQTGASVNLTGLTAGTEYTYKAYSDSNCTTELASETFTTNGFGLVATPGAQKISLSWTDAGKSGYDLYFCEDNTSTACTVPTSGGANPPYLGWITSGTTFEHTGLTPGKTYRYQVTHYSPTRRSNVAMAVPLGTLTAGSITAATATLTLGGHTGNWHYKQTAPTAGSCSTVQTGTTVNLTSLMASTSYTYKAYSDSNCTTELASETFSTTAPVPVLTAGSITAATATLTLANHAGNWHYKQTAPTAGSCSTAQTGTTVNLTSLTEGTSYTYKAYSDSNCTTELASETFSTAALTAGSITAATATLTLGGHTGNWHYKQTAPTAGSCSTVQTGASANLTDLMASTSYTYKAYSDSNCTTELASATFNTVYDLGLSVSATSASSITLSWTNHTDVTTGYDVYRCTVESECATNPPAGGASLYLSWVSKPAGDTITLVDDNNMESGGVASPISSGTTYYYAVRGYISGGNTGFSRVSGTAVDPPALTAGTIGATTATLTLANHAGNWHYKQTAPTAGSCSTVQTGTTVNLTSLMASTSYTYKAYSDSNCTTELASETFSTTAPVPVLTAGSITAATATLTLANHAGNWHYKQTAPTAGSCSTAQTGTTVNLTSLTEGTSYTYKAYSDSNCTTELASETFSTAALTAGSITAATATLTLGGHTGNWHYKQTAPTAGSCSTVQTGASANLTDLMASTSYTYKAYSDSNCTTELASETFTTAAPPVTLTAGSITRTTATLTLANHSGNWYYKQTAPSSGTCSGVQTTTSANLIGLMASNSYTYKAYSDSNCTTELASATFNTVYDLGLSVSATSASSITLSWTNHTDVTTGYDVYRCTVESECATNPPAGGASLYLSWVSKPAGDTITLVDDNNMESGGVASPISSGTTYYYAVRGYISGGNTGFSRVSGTAVDPPALTAGTIGATTATLTLANHAGNWHYKQTAPTAGSCSTVQTGTTVNLTSLMASTSYTYKAYSDSNCTTELASETFSTTAPVPVLTAGSITAATATLTLANHAGNWHYKQTAPTAGSCSTAQTGTTVNLTSLTEGTSYTYKAYSDSNCTTELASETFTTATPPVTLTAGSITRTTATLTLGGHTGNWHYKQTAPTAGSCSTVQTGATVNLTSLTEGNSYTYKAYSDSNCTTELASATFRTVYDLGLAKTASSASAITLSWTNHTDVTAGYDVYRCTVKSHCMAVPPAGSSVIYLSWVPKPAGATVTLVDDNDTEPGGRASPISEGTTYYYAMRGYTAAGDTGFARITATAGTPRKPKPDKPAKALGLIVTSVSEEAISLRWKPSSESDEEIGYGVYRCTVPEGKTTCEPYDDLWIAFVDNTNTYTDTEVTPGETYRYEVAADPLGRDNLSRAVTAVAQMSEEMVPPPTDLTVTETTAYSVRLSWTAPEDDGRGAIQAIEIYRCNMDRSPDCSEFLHLTGWNPALTEFRDNDVEPGTTYGYALASYRSAKEVSPWSNQVTATTNRGRNASPTGLTVTATFRDAISLSWTAPADGILGYNVYRCLVPAGETTCEPAWHAWVANPGDAPPAPTSYTDTGGETGAIVRNLTYLYVVAASYPPNYRNGDRSEPVTATARGGRSPQPETPIFPPASPTGLMAVPGAGGIGLSWAAPSDDIAGYSIYRCEEGETACMPEWIVWVANDGDAPPAPTGYSDTDVVAGTTYRYAVTSNNVDSDGEYHESDWSDEVTALAEGGGEPEPEPEPGPSMYPPASPTGLMAVPGAGGIGLSWAAPSDDIAGYSIYRCEEGETACMPEWIVWVANDGDAPPAPTGYSDTDVVAGTTYRYAVTSNNVDSDGEYHESDWSDEVTALAEGGGEPEPEPEPGPSMYPPASPTGLMAVPGAGGIGLSWAAPSDDIAGYSIYRCEEGETACMPEWIVWVANDGDAPPAPTGYSDTDVVAGTTYRYAVTSNNVDSDGEYHESDWSDEVTVVAREGSPGAPTNLAATPGNEQITLTWTPPAGTVTGWELLVRTDTDTGSWMSITPSGTTTKSYIVTDLTNGVQYTFLVRAVNGMLKGAPAGRRGATTVPSLNAGEFEASFESRHQWFRRDVLPELSGNTTWNSIAWKGERIQQHILVNNVPSNSRISLASSDLTSGTNDTIPAGAVSFRYPRFVAGHTEVRSCSKDYQEENRTAYLSDALFSAPNQALSTSWPELVWMSVDIPSDTPPGKYSGTVSVRAVSATAIDSAELHFSIQVVPWTMPDAEDRQFHLDLWQFPVSVLDRYNDANSSDRITIWSKEHYALLEPTYRYLAGLGQRTVTTYIKEGALGAPSMIQWTLKSDSSWEYDYSVFDAYVTRLASWGLDEQISAFSPVGWNEGDIPYWDEANQRKETFSAEVGSSDWNARWQHFLTDFRAHLLERGWFDKTVLYLDETPGGVEAVVNIVSAIDESWKVGLAYAGYGHDGPGEQVLSKLYDGSGSMALVGTTYVDTGLITGKTYRYAVDAVNDRASAASTPVTVVAQTPAVPGEPTSLTGRTGTAGVTLNWTAPAVVGSSPLTGYNIYRCVDGTASCTPVWFDSVTSGATYTDPYVTANTAYRYTVEACNGTGCGNQAGEITVMSGDTASGQSAGSDDMAEPGQTPQHQAVPDVPTGLTAFAASATAIQLSWEGSAVKGFDVYRCAGSETCDPVTYRGWAYADNYTPDPDRISTYYTSCVQPRPNSFVAAAGDPADVAALPWHALQRRQDGYLRWAFDNWRSSDPLDVREGAFTAGDFSLVYRSGNSKGMTVVPSIRSELLRDGIEDFEKVQVLRSSLSSCAENKLARRWLDRLERTVDTFSAAPLMAGQAGNLLNQAHDRLGEISVQLAPDMCR